MVNLTMTHKQAFTVLDLSYFCFQSQFSKKDHNATQYYELIHMPQIANRDRQQVICHLYVIILKFHHNCVRGMLFSVFKDQETKV